MPPPPPPELVEGEEEWEVEEILDSRLLRKKLKFLVKWKGYGREHNSWEDAADVFAPELVKAFYNRHPGAPRFIRALLFDSIPFQPLPTVTSSRCDLEGGVDVRGHLTHSSSPMSSPTIPPSVPMPSTTLYIPPFKRLDLQSIQKPLNTSRTSR